MSNHDVYTARRGELDLRGYEIVRVQFFDFAAIRSVAFSIKGIRFSSECIRNIGCTEYVRMLIHPKKKSIVVKPCTQEDKQKMRWAVIKYGTGYPREISCTAYIKTLYELFDWLPEYKYRFRGCVKDSDGERTIEFDLREPETITSEEILYPDDWDNCFGNDYYRCVSSRIITMHDDSVTTQYFYNTEPDIHPTGPEVLSANISGIINLLRNPEAENGAESDS